MQATQILHHLGQSLWLDNITRDLLDSGTLKRYIDELSVTGLTSNPTIFDHAIKNSTAYDAAIRQSSKHATPEEDLFFELAIEDLTRAAALFRPIYDRTDGVDGWVSLEVSPLLAYDTASTGTKDAEASDILYIKALAAPFTVNTMPEGTLKALAEHSELGALLPADGGDCEEVLAQFAKAGIDVDALAAQLQDEGAKSFVQSWHELMAVIASKSAALAKAG